MLLRSTTKSTRLVSVRALQALSYLNTCKWLSCNVCQWSYHGETVWKFLEAQLFGMLARQTCWLVQVVLLTNQKTAVAVLVWNKICIDLHRFAACGSQVLAFSGSCTTACPWAVTNCRFARFMFIEQVGFLPSLFCLQKSDANGFQKRLWPRHCNGKENIHVGL